MILHSDQEGNDCMWKLQCHCIQILHSNFYSVHNIKYCIMNRQIHQHAGKGFSVQWKSIMSIFKSFFLMIKFEIRKRVISLENLFSL